MFRTRFWPMTASPIKPISQLFSSTPISSNDGAGTGCWGKYSRGCNCGVICHPPHFSEGLIDIAFAANDIVVGVRDNVVAASTSCNGLRPYEIHFAARLFPSLQRLFPSLQHRFDLTYHHAVGHSVLFTRVCGSIKSTSKKSACFVAGVIDLSFARD